MQQLMLEEESTDLSVSEKALEGTVEDTPSVPDNRIRDELIRLRTVIESSYFETGKYLYRVLNRDLWRGWNFLSFEDYVEKDLGYKLRKAQYYITIWKTLRVDCGVQEDEMRGVTWSKAKEIQRVANPDNVYSWLERARTQPVHQLQEEVREAIKEAKNPGSTAPNAPKDQPVALEKLKRFGVNLYEEQYDILQKAIEIAKVRGKSDKVGHLLSLIAMEFCTYNTPEDETGALQWFMKLLEERFGTRLFAVSDEGLIQKILELMPADVDAGTDGE